LEPDTRNLKRDKENVEEKIQSFRRQTDYKQRIKNGEEVNDGGGIYMDISKLGNDYADIDKYITDAISNLKKDLENEKTQNYAFVKEGGNPPTQSATSNDTMPTTSEGGTSK
jgi:preprotein translocase subunit YajC